MEFCEALPYGLLMRGKLGGAQRDEIRDADRYDDSVQGLARPVFAQQGQKSDPARAVRLCIGVLRRVAPSCVDENRIVGNHQSQCLVPATPATACGVFPFSIENFRPELIKAVVLPDPGGPMMTYHGRS